MNKFPSLSIIFPVHNNYQYTEKLLRSIKKLKYPGFLETILIDNASTDQTPQKVKKHFPWVKIISNKTNLGFAKAVNIGAKTAKGQLLFFTNNDVVIPQKSLLILVEDLLKNPNIGVIGPKVIDYQTKTIHYCGARFNPFLGTLHKLNNPKTQTDTDWVTGCALLIKKELFYKLHGFDGQYFFNFEDFDLCLRVRKIGFQTIYDPRAFVFHKESATIDLFGDNKKAEELYKAKYRFIFKNIPFTRAFSMLTFQLLVALPYRRLFHKKPYFRVKPLLKGLWWNIKNLKNTLSDREKIKNLPNSRKSLAVIANTVNYISSTKIIVRLCEQLSGEFTVTLFSEKETTDPEVIKNLKLQGINTVLIPNKFFALRLFWKIRQNKPDLIFSHVKPFFLLFVKLLNTPVITNYYGTQLNAFWENFTPEEKPNAKNYVYNFLINQLIILQTKMQLGFSDYYIAISKFTAQEALKYTNKKPAAIIYLGADFPKYQGKENQEITLLSVSRFTPYKNQDKLIKLTIKYNQTEKPLLKLILVGLKVKSKYFTYLTKLSQKYKHIKLLTGIALKQLNRLYEECTIYVTADRYPFFGLPVIEAAAHQKPALAYNFGALKELVVNNKSGYLVNNDSDFLKKLHKLIHNKKLRQKMGQKAYEYAKTNFTWEISGKKYCNLLNKIAQITQYENTT